MTSIIILGFSYCSIYYRMIKTNNELVYVNDVLDEESKIEEEIPKKIEVYKNMTEEELADKLNKVLSSNLSGTGQIYAKYSTLLGVDPYLAVAISMHETGCNYDCSYLVKACNNVGGQKGSGCGAYAYFASLEEGIYSFILNIKNNYVDYGLYTASDMNPKYAEDPLWASKVNKYIEIIENS